MIYFLLAVLSFTVAVGLLALCSAVFFLHRRVGELEKIVTEHLAPSSYDAQADWEQKVVRDAWKSQLKEYIYD